ncbi:MAG: hypothetical protein HY222_04320 [Thaumarchaeota archaeon]|nr:hypothetical protein [Nitrososphaerota archaeon]MBI3641600.1 hypothetical protein [Nitrososphaerota archaeon]
MPNKTIVIIQIATAATTIGISILNKNVSPINTGRRIAKNFTLSMIPPKRCFVQSMHHIQYFVTTLYMDTVAFND